MDTTLDTNALMADQENRIADAISRERGRLGAFIRRRVPDPGTAEDILQDVFFEFVEAYRLPEPIEQAFDSLRKGGTCVVTGISRGDARARINTNQLLYAEKTLKGSLYGSMRPRIDLPRLMDLHQTGAFKLDELLTRTWRLEEINEAYAALERGEVARSLIVWE
jgi:Zn-dependent alcohol dehydrogenase